MNATYCEYLGQPGVVLLTFPISDQSFMAAAPVQYPKWFLSGNHTYKDMTGGVWKVNDGSARVTFKNHEEELLFEDPAISGHEIHRF